MMILAGRRGGVVMDGVDDEVEVFPGLSQPAPREQPPNKYGKDIPLIDTLSIPFHFNT